MPKFIVRLTSAVIIDSADKDSAIDHIASIIADARERNQGEIEDGILANIEAVDAEPYEGDEALDAFLEKQDMPQ
jgi:hypothetical protein